MAFLLLAAFLAAMGGIAWACGPNRAITLSAFSGPPGREMVVTGAHFDPSQELEVRWNSSTGPILATPTPSAQGDFSATFTIPEAAPDTYLVVVRSVDGEGTPGYTSVASLVVTPPPSLTLTPRTGPPSGTVRAQGSLFGDGPVELRWSSATGTMITTTTGPDFALPVSIPRGARGRQVVVATARDASGRFFGRAAAALDVTHAYPVPARDDTVGPAIAAAALSAANRNRRVSRKGTVTLFCGRFEEDGVSGECGARSTRRLKPPATTGGRRGSLLLLRDKRFSARKGLAVRVRFRLSRKAMAALKRARKARMRGHVASRDRARNETRATFRFTLKAPQPKRRPRSSAPGPAW